MKKHCSRHGEVYNVIAYYEALGMSLVDLDCGCTCRDDGVYLCKTLPIVAS